MKPLASALDSALTQIERPLTRLPANVDQLLVTLQLELECTATRARILALLRWGMSTQSARSSPGKL